MKISTLMVVAAVALSFAVSGCKYDKTRTGAKGGSGLAGANGSDISTTIDDLHALHRRRFRSRLLRL